MLLLLQKFDQMIQSNVKILFVVVLLRICLLLNTFLARLFVTPFFVIGLQLVEERTDSTSQILLREVSFR